MHQQTTANVILFGRDGLSQNLMLRINAWNVSWVVQTLEGRLSVGENYSCESVRNCGDYLESIQSAKDP